MRLQPWAISMSASSAANSAAVGGRSAICLDIARMSRSDNSIGTSTPDSGRTGSRRMRRITEAGDSPS